MWFIGMVIGAMLGATAGWAGFFIGACVGATGGAMLSAAIGKSETEARFATLESAIGELHKALEQMTGRLAALEQKVGLSKPAAAASAPVVPVTEAPAPAAPATVVPQEVAMPVEPPAVPAVVLPAPQPVMPKIAAAAWPAEQARLQGAPEVPAAPQPAPHPAASTPVTKPVAAASPHALAAASAIKAGEAPAKESADAPKPPHASPPPPRDLSPVQIWWSRLISGNIVAKAGVIILFFGVGFLLKYAYENAMLPVPLRLAGVALAGAVLPFIGWRMRDTRRLYGLILQGAGVGLIYLDVYFALRVYSLLHPLVGFFLFFVLGVCTTLLAVRQDARPLALLGLTGAFLAPVLAGSHSGNHVLLFSYYTLLNSFILSISWYKSWRDLNLTGFIFTFVIGLAWGSNNYRPELFGSVEPFVLIFFAMYLVIPVLFATRQPPQLKGLVDGTLVFGTPMSVAFMQASLVHGMPHGLAWSAGAAAGLYAVLAAFVWRRDAMRMLAETYVALAVVFATMAIFFALDAYPTFALWTLEGSAIVWVGLRQQRVMARAFGIALQLAAALLFLMNTSAINLANPWFNDLVLGCGLIFVAGSITAWLMHRYAERLTQWGRAIGGFMLIWAWVYWFAGGLHALYHGISAEYFRDAAFIFAGLSLAAAEAVGHKLRWPGLRLISLVHLLFMALAMIATGDNQPLAELSGLAWPLNFACMFWTLYRQRRDALLPEWDALRYLVAWCLLGVLASWEALWLLDHHFYGWSFLLAVGGVAAAWLRRSLRETDDPKATAFSTWVLLWAVALWMASGLGHIHDQFEPRYALAFGLGLAGLTCVLFELLGTWLAWPVMRLVSLMQVPAIVIGLFFIGNREPLADYGVVAWPLSFLGLFWCLSRQRRDGIATLRIERYFLAWLLLGVLATWEAIWLINDGDYGWSFLLAVLALAGASLRFGLRERGKDQALGIALPLLGWAVAVWAASGLGEIHDNFDAKLDIALGLGFAALSCGLFDILGGWLRWTALRRTQILLLLAMLVAFGLQFLGKLHPSADGAGLAWLAAFAVGSLLLYRQEAGSVGLLPLAQHTLGLWLGTGLLTWELFWQLQQAFPGSSWPHAAWGLVPGAALLIVVRFGEKLWPWSRNYVAHTNESLVPFVILGLIWSLSALPDPVQTNGGIFLPILNPLDLAQIVVLFGLRRWQKAALLEASAYRACSVILVGLGFLWVNALLVRTICHWTNIDYAIEPVFHSIIVQAAVSLLWTSMALVVMVTGVRVARRSLWVVGAVLLAAVVVKLFLVDLANSGTVERIVTFLGVGILLMVIGYFAPVPPGATEAAK